MSWYSSPVFLTQCHISTTGPNFPLRFMGWPGYFISKWCLRKKDKDSCSSIMKNLAIAAVYVILGKFQGHFFKKSIGIVFTLFCIRGVSH